MLFSRFRGTSKNRFFRLLEVVEVVLFDGQKASRNKRKASTRVLIHGEFDSVHRFLQGHGVMLNSHHSWPFRHHFSSKFWNIDQNLSEPIRNCFPNIFMIPEASRELPFMISRHLEKSDFLDFFMCDHGISGSIDIDEI